MIENEPAGNSITPISTEMTAYDALPEEIRKFLRGCPYNFDAANVLYYYNQFKRDHGPWAIQMVLDWKRDAVRQQRQIELRAGRLVPQAVRQNGQTPALC